MIEGDDVVGSDDVARANIAADPSVDGPCNVASGHPCSILEMAETVASAFGVAKPEPVVTGGFRLGDVRHICASTVHSRDALRFFASVHPYDGLRQIGQDPMRAPLR